MTATLTVGGFIAARRRDLDLDVETAAARAHMTADAWREVERDELHLLFSPLRVAVHVAVALDCSLDQLAAAAISAHREAAR